MTEGGPVGLELRDYQDLVRRALEEDTGRGDLTTRAAIDPRARARGVLVMKSAGVVAGLDVAIESFRQLDPSTEVTVLRRDGHWCEAGESIAEIRGRAQALLTGERTLDELGDELLAMAIDVAGGALTKPERLGHREYFITYKHQDTPPLEIGCRA